MIYYQKGNPLQFFRLAGSVIPRCIPKGLFSAGLCVFYQWWGGGDGDWWSEQDELFGHPYAHQVVTIVTGFLLVFRSNLTYQRFWEGKTQLENMSSKWADAVAQAIVFDELRAKVEAVEEANKKGAEEPKEEPANDADKESSQPFRRRMVHSMSLLHAVATETLHDANGKEDMNLDVVGGITDLEQKRLSSVDDPVYLVMIWVQRELVMRMNSGGLPIPAPILSRMYQELSNGMLGYNQARKIVQTPFPFPYIQLVVIMLYILCFSIPLVMAVYVRNVLLAPIMTFIVIVGYHALNEVSQELQDPFGSDANDLPLLSLHKEFNARLAILLEDTELNFGTHAPDPGTTTGSALWEFAFNQYKKKATAAASRRESKGVRFDRSVRGSVRGSVAEDAEYLHKIQEGLANEGVTDLQSQAAQRVATRAKRAQLKFNHFHRVSARDLALVEPDNSEGGVVGGRMADGEADSSSSSFKGSPPRRSEKRKATLFSKGSNNLSFAPAFEHGDNGGMS